MQKEISSSEGVQQGVSALSFAHFCYAIFEGEQARREDWWLGSEQYVQVFLERLEPWLLWYSVSRSRDEERCLVLAP